MKNIIKTLVVMLTSISFLTSAKAGELTVTGTAKATMNMLSGFNGLSQGGAGKGLGIANEFDLGANGELDNGVTWKYQIQMDPGNSGATNKSDVQNDDSRLEIGTTLGTIGLYKSEGGVDLEDGASQSVYGRTTDIGGNDGVVDNYDVDSYSNVQYHTPSGLLPYGIAVKLAYVPDTTNVYGSSNTAGTAYTAVADGVGRSAQAIQIKAAPIEGLAVGASYMDFSDDTNVGVQADEPMSASAMATYAYGAAKIGYSRAVKVLAKTANTHTASVQQYNQDNMSISYLVNDSLSVSFEQEQSEAENNNRDLVHVEQKSTAIQAAYTMGGMTLALSHSNLDNVGYASGKDSKQTLFAVTMAF